MIFNWLNFTHYILKQIILFGIISNICYLYAKQIPPMTLPEKEFIVYDLRIEKIVDNGNNEIIAEDSTVDIDTTPNMPNILVRLRPDYPLLVANMQCEISYNENSRSDLKTYTTMSPVNSWFLNYNGEFQGGKTVITANGGVIKNTMISNFYIRGNQPDKNSIVEDLSTEQRVVMFKENGYRHFLASGLPDAQLNTNGTYDWGLMQINDINNPTGMDIWNWRSNKSRGLKILETAYSEGVTYPSRVRKKYINARDWISDEERWTEGFQRYNGGNAYTWIVDPPAEDPANPTPEEAARPGSWQINPNCSGYGAACWEMKIKVENNNPPMGW